MHPSFALLFSALSAGSLFLAAFLLLTGVVQANREANKWLGTFYLLLSLLFIELFLERAGHPQALLILGHHSMFIYSCIYICTSAAAATAIVYSFFTCCCFCRFFDVG
jgi:hypothetical protein